MCVFCKLANKEIPSNIIYEDSNFLGILDISQATKGHILIIPKGHYIDLYEMDNLLLSKIMLVVKKVSIILKEKYNLKGLNVLQNNGEIAGQSVMHYHIHLIPRYDNDNFSINFTDNSANYNLSEIKKFILK